VEHVILARLRENAVDHLALRDLRRFRVPFRARDEERDAGAAASRMKNLFMSSLLKCGPIGPEGRNRRRRARSSCALSLFTSRKDAAARPGEQAVPICERLVVVLQWW
jgi:hypothetical protein